MQRFFYRPQRPCLLCLQGVGPQTLASIVKNHQLHAIYEVIESNTSHHRSDHTRNFSKITKYPLMFFHNLIPLNISTVFFQPPHHNATVLCKTLISLLRVSRQLTRAKNIRMVVICLGIMSSEFKLIFKVVSFI